MVRRQRAVAWAARLLQNARLEGVEIEAIELDEILLRAGDRAGAAEAFSSVVEPAGTSAGLRLRVLLAALAR